MGKHRNATQNGIFVKFMEEHEDIARDYTKRDRVEVESLWQEFTQSLNSAGPPSKDFNGWKRIWTEWTSEIKKKLAHNKTESRATGGGPFNKFHLTKTEEAILQMCGIKLTVDGVSGMELGIVDEELRLNDDTIAASTSKRRLESPLVPCTPKKKQNFLSNVSLKIMKPKSTRFHDTNSNQNPFSVLINDNSDWDSTTTLIIYSWCS